MIYEKTGVEVYVDSYKVRNLNMGLTITAANDKETTAEPKIVTSDPSVLSIEGDVVKPLKAGSATVSVSIDGLEKSFTVNIHDFDIYNNNNMNDPITGENVELPVKDFSTTGNIIDLEIISHGNQSTISNLKYIWCFGYDPDDNYRGATNLTMLKITGSGTNGSIARTSNYEKPKATILIGNDSISKILAVWIQLDH